MKSMIGRHVASDGSSGGVAGQRQRGMTRSGLVRAGTIALVAAALAVLLVVRIVAATSVSRAVSHLPPSLVGHAAPDFVVTLWTGGNDGNNGSGEQGQRIELAALKGKPVVVNFWASWCEPCQTEAPMLASAWQSYNRKGVVFVGLALQTTAEDGQRFMRQYAVPYPCGQAPDTVAPAYALTGIPVTVLIDRRGIVNKVFAGPVEQAMLDAALQSLVA